jgi:hypothetical protein
MGHPDPKHVDFHAKSKFAKLVHPAGLIIKKMNLFINTAVSTELKECCLSHIVYFLKMWRVRIPFPGESVYSL